MILLQQRIKASILLIKKEDERNLSNWSKRSVKHSHKTLCENKCKIINNIIYLSLKCVPGMQDYPTELPLLVFTFPSPASKSTCKYIGISLMALYFLLQHIWSDLKAQWNQWSQPLISPSYLWQINFKSQNFSLKCPGKVGRLWDDTNTQPQFSLLTLTPC